MPSVCFATIRLRRSLDSSLLLPIMQCFLSNTLLVRNLFKRHQSGLHQLILLCTNRGQVNLLNTDKLQLLSWLARPFYPSFSSCVQYLFPVPFHFITHNLIYEHKCLDSLYVCITWVDADIWWKFHVNSLIRNMFFERNVDVFNTYFPRCILLYITQMLASFLYMNLTYMDYY